MDSHEVEPEVEDATNVSSVSCAPEAHALQTAAAESTCYLPHTEGCNASQAAGMECDGDNLSPLGNSCNDPRQPCCALLSDAEDLLVPATLPGVRSGIRARLPARDPERGRYARSAIIKNITFGDKLYIGGMSVYPKAHGKQWDLGDEFPTSWSDDGYQCESRSPPHQYPAPVCVSPSSNLSCLQMLARATTARRAKTTPAATRR